MWESWEDESFDPTGDESLGGRLARFIIEQNPQSRLAVLHDYTFADWDDTQIYHLTCLASDFNVTLTLGFLDEIRKFAVSDQCGYSEAILNKLAEYDRLHQPVTASA